MGWKSRMPKWMGAMDCEPLPLKDWTNLNVMPDYQLKIYVKDGMVVDNIKKIIRYKRKMEKIYKHVMIIVI